MVRVCCEIKVSKRARLLCLRAQSTTRAAASARLTPKTAAAPKPASTPKPSAIARASTVHAAGSRSRRVDDPQGERRVRHKQLGTGEKGKEEQQAEDMCTCMHMSDGE